MSEKPDISKDIFEYYIKQELISEFVNNLKNHKKEISKTSWSGYIYSRKEEIKMVEELIKKWEEKLK